LSVARVSSLCNFLTAFTRERLWSFFQIQDNPIFFYDSTARPQTAVSTSALRPLHPLPCCSKRPPPLAKRCQPPSWFAYSSSGASVDPPRNLRFTSRTREGVEAPLRDPAQSNIGCHVSSTKHHSLHGHTSLLKPRGDPPASI